MARAGWFYNAEVGTNTSRSSRNWDYNSMYESCCVCVICRCISVIFRFYTYGRGYMFCTSVSTSTLTPLCIDMRIFFGLKVQPITKAYFLKSCYISGDFGKQSFSQIVYFLVAVFTNNRISNIWLVDGKNMGKSHYVVFVVVVVVV